MGRIAKKYPPQEMGYFEEWHEIDLSFERLERKFNQEEIAAGLYQWLLLQLGDYGEVPDLEEWMITRFGQRNEAIEMFERLSLKFGQEEISECLKEWMQVRCIGSDETPPFDEWMLAREKP